MSDVKIVSIENVSSTDLVGLEHIFTNVWPVYSNPGWIRDLEKVDKRFVEKVTSIAQRLGCTMAIVNRAHIEEVQATTVPSGAFFTNNVTVNFYRKQ